MLQKSMTGIDTVEGGQVVGLASPAAGAWGQEVLWLHFNLLQAVTIVGVSMFSGTTLFRLWLGI